MNLKIITCNIIKRMNQRIREHLVEFLNLCALILKFGYREQKRLKWHDGYYCSCHLTYIFLLEAEHLILDCKQTSIPPGALWEGQQTHLDQPKGRKQNIWIKYSCLALQKNLASSFASSSEAKWENHWNRQSTAGVLTKWPLDILVVFLWF